MAVYIGLRTLAGLVLLLIVFGLAVYWIIKALARKKKEAGIRKEKERFLPLGKDLRGGKAMLGRRSGGHR